MKKNIILIGAGKRLQNDVIPALEVSDAFNVVGIYARSTRTILISNLSQQVRSLNELDFEKIKKADWIYIGVPSSSLRSVFKFLAGFPLKNISLLVDTPVIPWRYSRVKKYFKNFYQVVVAEDIVYLPWIEPLKKALGGKITEMIFEHSAYAYHGIALAKTLADCRNFKKARLDKLNGETAMKLEFSNGAAVSIFEPRDYAKGAMIFSGPSGKIDDCFPYSGASMFPIVCEGKCLGINIAGEKVIFSEQETKLIGPVLKNATITSMTLQLKRIGLLKIFKGLAEEEKNGRNVSDAVSDTRLNEFVHWFGWFVNVARFLP